MKLEPVSSIAGYGDISADPQVPVVPEAEPEQAPTGAQLIPASLSLNAYMSPHRTNGTDKSHQRSNKPQRLGQLPSSRHWPPPPGQYGGVLDAVGIQPSISEPRSQHRSTSGGHRTPWQPARAVNGAAPTSVPRTVPTPSSLPTGTSTPTHTPAKPAPTPTPAPAKPVSAEAPAQPASAPASAKPGAARSVAAAVHPSKQSPAPHTLGLQPRAAAPVVTSTPVATSTPAPTRAPVATSTPTATSAPVATAAPAATRAPVATSSPAAMAIPTRFPAAVQQQQQQPQQQQPQAQSQQTGKKQKAPKAPTPATNLTLSLQQPRHTLDMKDKNGYGTVCHNPAQIPLKCALEKERGGASGRSAMGKGTGKAIESIAGQGASVGQSSAGKSRWPAAAADAGEIEEDMVLMARCRICRGIFPMEDFPSTGQGRGIGENAPRKCAPCQRLLYQVKDISAETEAKVCEMLEKATLQKHLQTLPWMFKEPITTRFNPDHNSTFPAVGCYLFPRSKKSPNTGRYSVAADAEAAIASALPRTSSAAAAAPAVRAPAAAPAAAAAAAPAAVLAGINGSARSGGTSNSGGAAAAVAGRATERANAAMPQAASKGVGRDGGDSGGGATAASYALNMSNLSPTDRASAVACLAAVLAGSPVTTAPTAAPIVATPAGTAASAAAAANAAITPAGAAGSQQKRKRDKIQSAEQSASPHAAASSSATISGTAATDADARATASNDPSKRQRNTGKQTRSQARKVASPLNGTKQYNDEASVELRRLQASSQPAPELNASSSQLVYTCVPQDWLARTVQLGMVRRQPDLQGPAQAQEQAQVTQQQSHTVVAAVPATAEATAAPEAHASDADQQVQPAAPASVHQYDDGDGAAEIPAMHEAHAGGDEGDSDGESGGATASDAEADAHGAPLHASNPCIESRTAQPLQQLGSAHACGSGAASQRQQACASTGQAIDTAGKEDRNRNQVGGSLEHACARSQGSKERADMHGENANANVRDVEMRENCAGDEGCRGQGEVNVHGLTSAILEGHLASVKLCKSARQKALEKGGLTVAEQQLAVLAEEHLKKLNALLADVV